MPKIPTPDKQPGELHYAAEYNAFKASINAAYDLIGGLQAVLASDDLNLDSVQELVAYLKANKALIDSITAQKLNVADLEAKLPRVDFPEMEETEVNGVKTLTLTTTPTGGILYEIQQRLTSLENQH